MDIGDPSEIPATRRRLPSMQELGAFDMGDPADAAAAPDSRPSPLPGPRPPVAAAGPAKPLPPLAAGATPAAAAVPAAAPRLALTPDQLRQALAKADPQTRQKLMRLIAGGRTVQQVGGAAAAEGGKRRSLVMPIDAGSSRPPPPGRTAAATAPAPLPSGTPSGFGSFSSARGASRSSPAMGSAERAGAASFGASSRNGAGSDQAVLRIDEHTELLDAAPPPPNPAARRAELQAQLDQVQAPSTEPVRGEPLAHKVLFPTYDPARHGDDVHGASRRRHEGPIEGHYPAPRQPFKPTYRHPDGRPMSAEETKVEEVLQTERCEETLGVLARDGVNGLLLSPRDLDAAVADGVISAEAAATLWKTWSALRPVIHVIEDDPPATEDENENEGPAPALSGEAPDKPAAPEDVVVPATAELTPAEAVNPPPAPLAPAAAVPVQAELPTLPLPDRLPERWQSSSAALTEPIASAVTPPVVAPGSRLKAWGRGLFWLFVAYCVLTTTSRLAILGWRHWGHWFVG